MSHSPLEPEAEWHSRGYLPHWEAGTEPQAICFRLADSLPRTVRERWEEDLTELPDTAQNMARRKRIEAALDAGYGEAFLAHPPIGTIVEAAFSHFDAERYSLHAWCVMPNHVHLLVTRRRLGTPCRSWSTAGSPIRPARSMRFVAKAERSGLPSISIGKSATSGISRKPASTLSKTL
jgi:hypothetical protein